MWHDNRDLVNPYLVWPGLYLYYNLQKSLVFDARVQKNHVYFNLQY